MSYTIKGGFSTKDPNYLEKIQEAMGEDYPMAFRPATKEEMTAKKEDILKEEVIPAKTYGHTFDELKDLKRDEQFVMLKEFGVRYSDVPRLEDDRIKMIMKFEEEKGD